MKKTISLLFLVFVSITICHAQYRYVRDIKEIPKGWICVGVSFTQENILGGGWKNIPEYRIEDGRKYSKGKQLLTCLLDNLDRTEWNVVTKYDDCVYCYSRFKQGTNRFSYAGWTIVKVTDAISPSIRNDAGTPKAQPYMPAVKRPEDRFGNIGFYTNYTNGFSLYIYKVSSKADKIKKYETGYSKTLPPIFNVKEDNLVYSNKLDRYYTSGKPKDFNSDGVLSMTLTEGTYKVVVYDDGYLTKFEKIFEIVDGSSTMELISPTQQMGMPYSYMQKENVEKNAGLTIEKPTDQSKLKRSSSENYNITLPPPPPPTDYSSEGTITLADSYIRSLVYDSDGCAALQQDHDKNGDESIVTITIVNFDNYKKLPLTKVWYYKKGDKVKRQLYITEKTTSGSCNFLTIICFRENSNLKIKYNID